MGIIYSYSTDPTKLFSKIKELTEDTVEDLKKCEILKEYTSNKITTSKYGSVLDDSIFKEIDKCKKLKETTKDQVKYISFTKVKNVGGISKHTVKKDITIDDYHDTLFSSTNKTKKKKKKKSCEITKCSLSSFDNKR